MIRLLYIEDDMVDQQLFLRELRNDGYVIDITSSFDEAKNLIKLNTYSLVVSDRRVGPDDLLEDLEFWKSNKLIILSNNIASSQLKDITCFEKPFKRSMLEGVLQKTNKHLEQLELLCDFDEEAIAEMSLLINQELENTHTQLSVLRVSDEYKQQADLIHKVLNKIGILGMEKELAFFKNLELKLRNKEPLSSEEFDTALKTLSEALTIIKSSN